MIAVIYYAYGAPKSIDDVEAYFSHILNGKPVPAPMLQNILSMFKKSGYPDFIRSSTERISKGIQLTLNQKFDEDVVVYPAYKHTAPFIPDAYEQAVQAGADTIVTLAVNPILSVTGGGVIHAEIAELNKNSSIKHIAIDDYHLDEGIVSVYADRVSRAFNWLSIEAQKSAYVLFTVHSQKLDPERNESYVKQFEELATAVANKAGIEHFKCVYRSGRKEGWLAPDVKDAMRTLNTEGAQGFVTCELLSVSADVESYIEIVPECQDLAAELNVDFAVSEFPGDSFDTVIALSNLVEAHIQAELSTK